MLDSLCKCTIELPLSLLRAVFGLPQPQLTRKQVREMVKQEIALNWPEVKGAMFFVIPKLKHYYVPVEPFARGGHIAFVCDAVTGDLEKIDIGEPEDG